MESSSRLPIIKDASKKRDGNIDLLRIVCALAVIVIHIVSAPVATYDGVLPDSLTDILNVIHVLANPAVPLFFMITGYCLMKKSECTYRYCFSHVLKFIAVLFTVGLFYALLEEVFNAGTFQISMISIGIKRVIEGKIWDHMWFVYSIIGIYMVMPVLFAFFKQNSEKSTEGLAIVVLLFLFTIVFPILNKYITIGIVFPFNGFLFYVCVGCLLSGKYVKKGVVIGAIAVAAVSIVLIILNSGHKEFGYKSPEICLLAVSIFILFTRLRIKENSFMHTLAQCTWGCYILHPFFINLVLKAFKIDIISSNPGLRICLFGLVITAVSFGATYILRKIPLVKELF